MKKLAPMIFGTDRTAHLTDELFSSFAGSLCSNKEYTVLLGFCDVHVHFREPGFSYKGTVAAGSRAAARPRRAQPRATRKEDARAALRGGARDGAGPRRRLDRPLPGRGEELPTAVLA